MSSPVSRFVGHLLLPALLLAAAFAVLLGPALAVPRSEWQSLLPRVWTKAVCPKGTRDPSADCPALDPAAAVAAVAKVLLGAAAVREFGPVAAREIARRLDADGDAIVTNSLLPLAKRRSRQIARDQTGWTAW